MLKNQLNKIEVQQNKHMKLLVLTALIGAISAVTIDQADGLESFADFNADTAVDLTNGAETVAADGSS